MFKKKPKPELNLQPIERGFYAWNFLHAGSFLLYIESLNGYHRFMFLPGPSDFFLTNEDFSEYLKNGTLSIVDQLPLEVFQEAMKYSLPCPTNPPIVTTNEK